jgi:hypothetical protein
MSDGVSGPSGGKGWAGKATTYSWKSTIVPDIAFIREDIAYEPGFIVLDVLFYGIEGFVSGNLFSMIVGGHPQIA